MKFVTFELDNKGTALGLIQGDTVVNLTLGVQELLRTQQGQSFDSPVTDLADIPFHSVPNLVDAGENGIKLIDQVLQAESSFDASLRLPVGTVKLLAPMLRPKKNVICVGKNYVDHVMEFDKPTDLDAAIPKYPIFFTKSPTTVVGPHDAIESHRDFTSALDYEAEIAVIIGKAGTNIRPEEAFDYVFGYVLLNDVTARDLQNLHNQWFRGKSLDTFCPMGPYVLHRSAVDDVCALDIGCKVNGEVRQHSFVKNMIFDIPTIISVLSQGMTLEAGDIIATGTPEGVGVGFEPPKFLVPGDEVTVFSSVLGELTNKVV